MNTPSMISRDNHMAIPQEKKIKEMYSVGMACEK